MATVVVSTLMVLLARSGEDFQTLWDKTGSESDDSLLTTGSKSPTTMKEAIAGGNFRSPLIDDWEFDMIRIHGVNSNGDVLWTTHVNVTGTTSDLTSWLVGGRVTLQSSGSTSSNFSLSTDNYRLIQHPASTPGQCWFAISVADLSYGPLPLMFVPKIPDTSFDCPEIIDGLLGCWPVAEMQDLVLNGNFAGILTPAMCINACGSSYMAAVLMFGSQCHCANYDTEAPPTAEDSCFVTCPGDSSALCGGYVFTAGSAYHIQGDRLPGEVTNVRLYNLIFLGPISNITLRGSDITGSSSHVIISDVTVSDTVITTYTIQYSEKPCSEGEFLTFPDDKGTHVTNGSLVSFEVLRIYCLLLLFADPLASVEITINGPPSDTDHIEVPVTVIEGVKYIPTTTTAAASTSASTTTSTTTTSTTQTPTTTTTTPTTTTTQTPTITTSTTQTTTIPSTSTPTSTTVPSTSTNRQTTTPPSTPPPSTAPTSTSTTTTTTSTSVVESTSSTSPSTSQINPSASPSLTTTTTTTTIKSTCVCPCSTASTNVNLTSEQLVEKVVELQRRLAVNTSELSSTIRKLTSAEDDRPSAVSIGFVGVGIMAGVFGTIVIFDFGMILRDLKTLFVNLRSACQ